MVTQPGGKDGGEVSAICKTTQAYPSGELGILFEGSIGRCFAQALRIDPEK